MSWRLANSINLLLDEINGKWPNRDHASDGTIGDAAHIKEGSASDHNPWIVDAGKGVVRALDVDVDGIDAAWCAEHLRQLGAAGDSRLNGGGYVIFNRRIASEKGAWGWRVYNGSDPHTGHVHVSVSRAKPGYDSTAGWGVSAHQAAAHATAAHSTTTPVSPAQADVAFEEFHTGAKPGSRELKLGSAGDDVAFLQRFIGGLDADGFYGSATEARVRSYQTMRGITVNGIAGSEVWLQIIPKAQPKPAHV
jgi:peptidoglycan hydrolase-like protein with peptidoglycan-binding domain